MRRRNEPPIIPIFLVEIQGRSHRVCLYTSIPMEREIYVPAMSPGEVTPPSREIYGLMGEANIIAMMLAFYKELARSEVAALFPSDPVALENAAHKSALFFISLMGGPPRYQQKYGNPMMRARHMPFVIDHAARATWLACFERVLSTAEVVYQFPSRHLAGFRAFLNGFSMWMVNTNSKEQE